MVRNNKNKNKKQKVRMQDIKKEVNSMYANEDIKELLNINIVTKWSPPFTYITTRLVAILGENCIQILHLR